MDFSEPTVRKLSNNGTSCGGYGTRHKILQGWEGWTRTPRLGHANPSITLRIYSHWVPGMRRITTGVLDNKKNASNLQAQAVGKEFGNVGLP